MTSHHPACGSNEKVLMWVCITCGLQEEAEMEWVSKVEHFQKLHFEACQAWEACGDELLEARKKYDEFQIRIKELEDLVDATSKWGRNLMARESLKKGDPK